MTRATARDWLVVRRKSFKRSAELRFLAMRQQVTGQTLRQLMFAAWSAFCRRRRASAGTADSVDAEELRGVASIISGHGRCVRVSQSSDFGCKPADSAILCGDRLACGAESAFAIGELDFGGLATLLKLD
jgi:hypothetical protein